MKKENEALRVQGSKLASRIQSNSQFNLDKSAEKDHNPFSNYYDQNKENDCKDEMLKLPIFQKNKLSQLSYHETPSPRALTNPHPSCASQVSQVSQLSQVSQSQSRGVSSKKKA